MTWLSRVRVSSQQICGFEPAAVQHAAMVIINNQFVSNQLVNSVKLLVYDTLVKQSKSGRHRPKEKSTHKCISDKVIL